ncbi:AEC family transporter [Parasutterella excrementihominis]|uniref:AEC family transporter n=1 Tax=Parasutterella excrementihominis TaxID=487175 RepID=UPI003A8FB928
MFAVFVILPQFCLILLGYLLTKRPSFAKKDFWNVTEKLVFYVLFPPLIFLSVAKANLQIGQCSYFLLISISAMSIAVITAWLANFLIKESQWTKWSIFHCGFRFNTYIGFAICSTLFGDKGIAYLSLLIACWVPLSNVIATVGLVHASRLSGSENCGKRKNFLVAVLSNPLILATLLGLVCNSFSIELPKLLEDVLKPLGQSSLALGLICIGAGLKINDLKRYLQLMIIGSLQRLMVVPAVTLTFAIVFQLLSLESCVLLLFAALPTAQSCYVMTASMGGDSAAVADLTSAQVIFSLLTLPFWINIMLKFFPT